MTDQTAVDYRTTPPSIEPTATAWQAWWEDHDMWDGDMLYADLATAKHHSAVAYVGEEYSWLPGDDPDDEAPDTVLAWELKYGRWRLLDNGGDTGVRLAETRTYAAAAVPAGQAPDAGRDGLRDRIRRVLCDLDGQGALWGTDMLEPDEYGDHADMVLGALIGSDTDLRQAIDHRDYWHGEAMAATARIIELERKLAAAPAAVSAVPGQTDTTDLPARLEAALTERFTELGNPYSEMRRHEQGPDGWPASHPVGPRHVAEVLRELLDAEQAAAGAQQPKEA